MITAKEILDARDAWTSAESAFGDAAEKILSVTNGEWPYQDYHFDSYDTSFEFDACENGFRLTAEQVKAFADMGFERWWLNHLDGSETRYYRLKDGEWGSDRVRFNGALLEDSKNGGAA